MAGYITKWFICPQAVTHPDFVDETQRATATPHYRLVITEPILLSALATTYDT